MKENLNIKIGDQLYVNNLWYFDVIDIKDNTLVIRIKYKENPKIENYLYKTIAIENIFKPIKINKFIKYAEVNIKEFREKIGTLVDRIKKEHDVTYLTEDMGAVISPGIASVPGSVGTSGSGDISGSVFPNRNNFGFEIVPVTNNKNRKKLKTKAGKPIIKKPIISLSENQENQMDNQYKTDFLDFLEYPSNNDIDLDFLKLINDEYIKQKLINASVEKIKIYLTNIYTLNKTLIKNKTSEWFQNTMLVLSEMK